MILTAQQGDSLDRLIFRHYGTTVGLVEIALAHNPQLADIAMLPLGQQVIMPDKDSLLTPIVKDTVNLWD